MADTPKNPQQSGPAPLKNRPKDVPTSPAGTRASRHRIARHERELRRQRLVVVATGTALALALLAVLLGLGYDQLWIPSRPVAQVGATSLSRRSYWDERRLAFARQIAQNFQLVALFGGNQQFTQQFANQSPAINAQVKTIRTAPVDDAVVGQWETLQLKEQGAAKLEITVGQDEINQAMAQDLARIFIPPPIPPITATATLSVTAAPAAAATVAVTPTATLPATATAAPTSAPTATPGGPTATLAPTDTPAPTSTPEPTPQAAEAATQADQIIAEVFRKYELELANANEKPVLTKDDFRAALNSQYREQVLNRKVQEHLVPEQGFTPSSDPKRVHARQVLVAVAPPAGSSQEQIDALFAGQKARADTIVAQLRGGAAFADVAKASSDDAGSASSGGDLGFFDKDGTTENSDPIRTQFGWHVIEVTDREVPTTEEQLRDARTAALDKWLAEQRTAIAVERFPAQTPSPTAPSTPTTVPTYLPGPPTAVPTPEPTGAATAAPSGSPAPTSTATAP
jgi:parvulin-like peptidyl-prolyl isomerase